MKHKYCILKRMKENEYFETNRGHCSDAIRMKKNLKIRKSVY